jgi:hypothetical protein
MLFVESRSESLERLPPDRLGAIERNFPTAQIKP